MYNLSFFVCCVLRVGSSINSVSTNLPGGARRGRKRDEIGHANVKKTSRMRRD